MEKLWEVLWNYRKIYVNVKHLKKFWGNFETIFLKFFKNFKKTLEIFIIYWKNLKKHFDPLFTRLIFFRLSFFPGPKSHLKKRHFSTDVELHKVMSAFLEKQGVEWYRARIEKLVNHYDLDSLGDCVGK